MTPEHMPGVEQVIDYVESRYPDTKNTRHRWCMQCDEARAVSSRQYAHTNHEGMPNTICWAHAAISLPVEQQIGIALHEYGHLLADEAGCDSELDIEAAADEAVLRLFGLEIKYAGQDELQWVSEEALRDA